MIDDFRPVRPRPGHDPAKPDPESPAETTASHTSSGAPIDGVPQMQGDTVPDKSKKSRPHPWRALRKWVAGLSKKQKILFFTAIALIVLGLCGVGYVIYKETRPKPKPVVVKKVEVKPQPPPPPTTLASPLTGVQVTPDLAKRPVTGIMIENSPDARPQSGLKDAGVVYEAIAEGGITRFLTLFQEAQPDYIGPVRSSRPYYLDWLLPYDAAYAHVGGSPDALAQIKSLGVKDLDQFYNSAYYSRIPQRYAPHNVYTSMARMDQAKTAKGYTTSTFTGFVRKTDAANPTPTARTIDMAISGYLYNVHYDYDPATNSYKRSEGGKPHIDEKSGQITPKVAIALVMGRGIASDGQHTNYQAVGNGAMFVFQDGTVTQGTWSKPDRKAQFKFSDSAGKELTLNAGQTWITMVDGPGSVTYKP